MRDADTGEIKKLSLIFGAVTIVCLFWRSHNCSLILRMMEQFINCNIDSQNN